METMQNREAEAKFSPVPDARINADMRDARDGQIGVVGYAINFSRYLY